VVVIRRDGEIVFRQIATAKDDRLTAAEVVAVVDRTLAVVGPAVAEDYAAIDRIQLRVEAGAAALRTEATYRATGFGALAVVVPIKRYLLAGAAARLEARERIFQLDGLVGARLPILGDIGAIQLAGVVGAPLANADGPYFGARVGVWYAATPSWALQLDLGAGTWTDDRELFATFGIARLLRF